jgi:hypothetical protein
VHLRDDRVEDRVHPLGDGPRAVQLREVEVRAAGEGRARKRGREGVPRHLDERRRGRLVRTRRLRAFDEHEHALNPSAEEQLRDAA